jgi:outer membrane protein TolC
MDGRVRAFVTAVNVGLVLLASSFATAQAQTSQAPLTLTLQDALNRARANSVPFQTALSELGIAKEGRTQARAALLPSVNDNTQYIYTEGNGTPSGRFIANNGVHEYLAEGNAHQAFSVVQVAEFRRAGAAAALARAKAEIVARGLVVTVVESYYALVVAQRKFANTEAAGAEAQRFLTISQELERGGEVAHSDVIKAQLQFNDRQRGLREAQLAMEKARLALAVLVFRDFNLNFTVVDDLRLSPVLPDIEEVQQMAARNNPELQAAFAAAEEAKQEVAVALAAHIPALAFDYFYGIDANHFATRTNRIRNLGYSAMTTLTLPVWNWGAIQSKVKVANYRQRQAEAELSLARRKLLANLQGFYAEAQAARSELDVLRNSADLAAESLRLTTLRYQGGEASVLEVVDAQNTLTASRNAYDDGEARYRIAIANLQTLTGSF